MQIETGSDVLISVRNAGRIYRMGEVDVHALRNASIDIIKGEFLIINGPSGSGKSTLLNLIGGMDRPTSGSLVFGGEDLATFTDRQLTHYRLQEIGFVFQFYNLIPTLTAIENVQVTTEIASDPIDPCEALKHVGLTDRADHFSSQLSGGEQQRVAIARALSCNSPLLLCDEPTGALDLNTSRQILTLLQQVNRDLGKTVLLITHNNAISRLGDRVAYIRDGTIQSVDVDHTRCEAESISW